jgi:hypothetical protein
VHLHPCMFTKPSFLNLMFTKPCRLQYGYLPSLGKLRDRISGHTDRTTHKPTCTVVAETALRMAPYVYVHRGLCSLSRHETYACGATRDIDRACNFIHHARVQSIGYTCLPWVTVQRVCTVCRRGPGSLAAWRTCTYCIVICS